MELPLYQVDAFATRVFAGNPAAVCPLADAWPDDGLLQAIAAENNLSETAFFRPEGDGYRLRWFTPTTEVDLCGHATLAAAWVLFERLGHGGDEIRFHTASGPLTVARRGAELAMDFPAYPLNPAAVSPDLCAGLGVEPREVFANRDLLAVLESERQVVALRPDLDRLARVEALVVIATAPGTDCDFVSRCFSPRGGIGEDPVTGSAHCSLTPYWARRLGKEVLHARQRSARGGALRCRARGERAEIAGEARLYLEGRILC